MSSSNNFKTVLIAGATGNMGRACVKYTGEDIRWIPTLVSRDNLNLANWNRVMDFAERASTGPFDLVIMAHGTQTPCTLSNMTKFIWGEIIENNLSSSAALITALIKSKKINPSALIVFISSIQATQPRAGRGAYAAAKAGIEGLMRATAVELFDINARAIALRIAQMTEPMKGIKFTPDEILKINKIMPLGLVNPSSIAKLIFETYYNQPFITGEVIEISAGHNLNIW